MPINPDVLMKIDPAGTFRRAENEKMLNQQLGQYLLQQKIQTENMQQQQQDTQSFRQALQSGGPPKSSDEAIGRMMDAAIHVGNPEILSRVGAMADQHLQRETMGAIRTAQTHKLQFDSLGGAVEGAASYMDENPDANPEAIRTLISGPISSALRSGAITQGEADLIANARTPDQLHAIAKKYIPALAQNKEKRLQDATDVRLEAIKERTQAYRDNVDSMTRTREGMLGIRGRTQTMRERLYGVSGGGDTSVPSRLPSAMEPGGQLAPTTPATEAQLPPDQVLSNLPEQKLANAAEWIQTGKTPQTGMRKTVDAADAQRYGGMLLKVAGIDPTQLPLLRAASSKQLNALTELAKNKAAVEAFSTTANLNADLLRKASAELQRTDIPLINRAILAGQLEVQGNPRATRFLILARSVQNEYARLITQPRLTGQLTDTARREMEDLVSKQLNHDQIIMALDTLKQESENRRVGIDKELNALKSDIGIVKAGTVGGSKPSATPASGNAPDAAVNMLRSNPTAKMKQFFKQKYGYLPEGVTE